MKTKWKLWLALAATALWLWFIFARSAKTAVASDAESGAVLKPLLSFLPFLTMRLVRKLAHFAEYAILGGLLYLDWRLLDRGPILLPLGAGLLAAAADEFLQTFVPGRSGQIKDVLLDFFGVAVSVGIGWMMHMWKEARRRGS